MCKTVPAARTAFACAVARMLPPPLLLRSETDVQAAAAVAQAAADAGWAAATTVRAHAAEREAELKRSAEAEKVELMEKLAKMTALAGSACVMVDRAQVWPRPRPLRFNCRADRRGRAAASCAASSLVSQCICTLLLRLSSSMVALLHLELPLGGTCDMLQPAHACLKSEVWRPAQPAGGARHGVSGELTAGVVQEQDAAQQRRVAELERRVAECTEREQDLANAAGQERRQLEWQVASLQARNTALEVRTLTGTNRVI